MTNKAWLPSSILFWALLPGPDAAAQELPRVMIRTDVGSLEVEVDTINIPDAAGHFLIYVDQAAYDGGHFHRTFRAERLPGGKNEIEGIQGGMDPSRSKEAAPTALERKNDTGMSLGDKELSLPSDGPDPSTAEFFIRVGDQYEVGRLEPDGHAFIAFGRVVRGRGVVRSIHTARARDHRLTPPIVIQDVRRVK